MVIKTFEMTRWIRERLLDERGAGLAEYALLLFVVAVAVAGVVATFGGNILEAFTQASQDLPAGTTPTS